MAVYRKAFSGENRAWHQIFLWSRHNPAPAPPPPRPSPCWSTSHTFPWIRPCLPRCTVIKIIPKNTSISSVGADTLNFPSFTLEWPSSSYTKYPNLDSKTRGNNQHLTKQKFDTAIKKKFSSLRVTNNWNSLPDYIIDLTRSIDTLQNFPQPFAKNNSCVTC